MPTSSALLRIGAALGTALILFVGCGGDPDDPVTDPPATTSGASTPASGEATGPTPSSDAPTPSSDPSSEDPGAAPATGPVLDITGVALNIPQGWTPSPGDLSAAATDPGLTGGQILVQAVSAIEGVDTVDSLAKQAIQKAKSDDLAPTREADREVAGAPGYVLRGGNDLFPTWFEYGAVGTNGYLAIITIRFNQELPAAETDGYIDSILASVAYPPPA